MNSDAIFYTTAKQRILCKKYNKIIVCDLSNTRYKRAIGIRNRWFTAQSDVLLCHIICSYGTYQVLQINKGIRKLE